MANTDTRYRRQPTCPRITSRSKGQAIQLPRCRNPSPMLIHPHSTRRTRRRPPATCQPPNLVILVANMVVCSLVAAVHLVFLILICASGQALRNLPFTNTHHAGLQQPQLQANAAYAGMLPHARASYPHHFAAANAQAGYPQGSAHHTHAVHHETRYIPTPAQTMQSYQTNHPSRSALTPPKSSPSPGVERYACDKCDRTFSRPHDRKRHYESQHLQTSHSCQYCRKEFSRADSLKRHLDNGCDKMPIS